MAITGILLAAGAGTRMGGPKALQRGDDGTPWLTTGVQLLLDGGCDCVVVVIGAMASLARPLIPMDARVTTIEAADWADGMSHSLRAGLAAATGDAVLITLVDLPALPVAVLERVIAADGPLRQAVYDGRPGHPVYIASAHWAAAAASLEGDTGARRYLVAHGVTEVECGDIFDGNDVDE
jgi:CTP:molybdopterin cytidylyltransferase MocA